jgi:excisionase family DNA binding protein
MEAQIYNQEVLLKATQIAQILNISNSMAYRIIQTGELRSVLIGTARRVLPEDLHTYIQENLTSDPK